MTKIKYVSLILVLALFLTGCGGNDDSQELAKLKEELAATQKQVAELSKGNSTKETDFTTSETDSSDDIKKQLEELTKNNQTLSEKIASLEATNKSLSSTINSLKSSQTSIRNYTITKDQLVGKWEYYDSLATGTLEFTSNSEIIGNWIILEYIKSDNTVNKQPFSYLYKDGILYLSAGVAFKKIS